VIETASTALVLPRSLHRRITGHARSTWPREAVGLVGGVAAGVAQEVIALTNLATGSGRFFADPYEQFCALRRFEAEGLQPLAIYHSHPAGALEPSALDVDHGRRWQCLHLIVAVGRPDLPDGTCRAFHIAEDGAVHPARVLIADG